MTEDEFRKKMKELGWADEYIEDDIDSYRLALSLGVEPLPLETYIGKPPEIEHFP